jgi:predicted alpha/beta superfamily hydrolase
MPLGRFPCWLFKETWMSAAHASASELDCEDLGPAVVDWTAAHRLHDPGIGQDFLVEVAWPIAPVQPGEKVPVVYVLDGNMSFAMTAQIARSLQYGPFPLPKTFVVGIGYHDAYSGRGLRPGQLRLRDLTPCNDAPTEARLKGAPPPWALPPGIRFGGAAKFLAFIETAVKPFIAGRYPVDHGDATLLGMSAGGLCALYALFTQPASFKRYVALSPALYWGERHLFDLEAALAAGAPDLPVSLFLGVGGHEEAHDADQKMVSNVCELHSRLRKRAYPSLDLGFHVFPDETHMSVYPAGVSRGLTSVFGGPGDISDWSKVLRQ